MKLSFVLLAFVYIISLYLLLLFFRADYLYFIVKNLSVHKYFDDLTMTDFLGQSFSLLLYASLAYFLTYSGFRKRQPSKKNLFWVISFFTDFLMQPIAILIVVLLNNFRQFELGEMKYLSSVENYVLIFSLLFLKQIILNLSSKLSKWA